MPTKKIEKKGTRTFPAGVGTKKSPAAWVGPLQSQECSKRGGGGYGSNFFWKPYIEKRELLGKGGGGQFLKTQKGL